MRNSPCSIAARANTRKRIIKEGLPCCESTDETIDICGLGVIGIIGAQRAFAGWFRRRYHEYPESGFSQIAKSNFKRNVVFVEFTFLT